MSGLIDALIACKQDPVAIRDVLVRYELIESDDENTVYITNPSVMIRLSAGKEAHFRCPCGANVFSHLSNDLFECNGCGAWYTGEKEGEDADIQEEQAAQAHG